MASKILKFNYLHRIRSNIFKISALFKNPSPNPSPPAKTPSTWAYLTAILFYCYKNARDYSSFIPVVKAEEGGSHRKRFNFISDVVDKVANAVVFIEVKNLRFFSIMPSNGSGFIIHEDGLILTNAHVVLNRLNSSVQVKLTDGRTYQGVVEDIDIASDLALVRVNAKKLPVMKLGSSFDLRPGEWVVAIGSPLTLSNTITTGVVSAAHRQSAELGMRHKQMEYIQTDAAITFGNSGGPLVNLDGEAIGINCMKITGGISFAIPIDYAKEFLKRSQEKRKIQGQIMEKSKYTGVTIFALTPDLLQDMLVGDYQTPQEVTKGVFVGKVVMGSPAYNGGLKPGDIVTHVNSKAIEGIESIYQAAETGEPLKFTVIRGGVYLDVVVTPEEN